ncbi:MAG: methyltransferase domain-containing protein [Candidatus Thermoplasmatota archaeon]|nr:methyltransferase domain-containing protein [Candidatus Thermoplasmatota archaeon]
MIEDTELLIGSHNDIKTLQPVDFKLETTDVWSFPKRGDWATHPLNARYRGNWAPQVVRNLILRYSKEGDTVLDSFVGSGTTLIECKLTNRKGIGVDVNEEALILTRDRLKFSVLTEFDSEQKTYLGDARELDFLEDGSVDLITTHPPYANIISYTKNSNHQKDGDLSKVRSVDDFCQEIARVAKEFYRVLKPDHYCAILMGDTRRHKHHVPISFRVMQTFLEEGFVLKEDIIKIQHNTKTAPLWEKMSIKSNFLLLMHEHLFVFRKPKEGETLDELSESLKWW